MYPFGYGLSYGYFEYSDLKLSAGEYGKDQTIKARITVANNGTMDATETVQLYVRDHVASVTRPVKELKQFRRVPLRKGEKQTIEFELPVSELSYIGADLRPRIDSGDFTLFIGGNSETTLSAIFSIK